LPPGTIPRLKTAFAAGLHLGAHWRSLQCIAEFQWRGGKREGTGRRGRKGFQGREREKERAREDGDEGKVKGGGWQPKKRARSASE